MRKIKEYFKNEKLLEKDLQFYLEKKKLIKNEDSEGLIQAHLEKAKHNLSLVSLLIKNKNFDDWIVISLYYSLYHSCLALLAKKGYVSKNHTATLLFLIKNYSNLTYDEIETIEELSVTKEDAKFYTDLKQERHNANYSTKSIFTKKFIQDIRRKTISFINKVEVILEK